MSSKFTRQVLSIKGAYLELIESEHMEEFYQLFESNRDYLRQHIPGVDSIQTREDLGRRWAISTENSLKIGLWLNEKQMIGRCRLTRYEDLCCADIGYWISESHQGQGLMTVAVEQLVNFVFQKWNVKRVEIHCGVKNFKSQAIPERLGFINEGISKNDQGVLMNGQIIQSIIYSKSNPIN